MQVYSFSNGVMLTLAPSFWKKGLYLNLKLKGVTCGVE
jgi:hypothetical protein